MPRPTKYVSRSDLGWGSSPATSANPRSGLVIHYDSANQNLANKDHSACLTYWRNTRAFHTGPQRGWVDVGYSWMSCSHGYILEGRGLYRTQAAQPGGNTSHYSVTLATGPTDAITPEQINAVRELRQWLMEPDTSIAGTVLGHRDFIATSCPGDRAYALVKDGTFAQPPNSAGDDMPDHSLYATTPDQVQNIPAGEWTTLRFGRIHRNGGWEEKTPEPSFIFGPALYSASVGLRVDGLEAGQEFQVRLAYYRETASGSGTYERYATMPIDSPTHDAGQGHWVTSWDGKVASSRKGRVRVEVNHFGSEEQTVSVTFARAEALVWKI